MVFILVRSLVVTARKLAFTRRKNIVWSSAKVEDLLAQSVQCYRCLRREYVSNYCQSVVDNNGHCFSCGGRGHNSRSCTTTLKCPLCSALEVLRLTIKGVKLAIEQNEVLRSAKSAIQATIGDGSHRTKATSSSHQTEDQLPIVETLVRFAASTVNSLQQDSSFVEVVDARE